MIEIFKKHNIDAIISPSVGTPALKHTQNAETMLSCLYALMWNTVNFPSGVIPITKVEENEQHYKNSQIKDLISS